MKKKEKGTDLKRKVENGKIVSPVLPEGVKNYLIDIDGTIGDDIPNENLREWSQRNNQMP